MGTSASRRAPTSRRWRLAKSAATRYLSPEGGRPVTAREVAASYVAALEETPGPEGLDLLGSFRLTRKTGQNLGDFLTVAAAQGWDAALTRWGLEDLLGQASDLQVQALSASLAGASGSLEEAAARTALVRTMMNWMARREPPALPSPEASGTAPAAMVCRFLADAVYVRLVLDLGEPLEAAGHSYAHLRQGLDGLKSRVEQALDRVPIPAPPKPDQWPGLAGWTWVTQVMDALFRQLKE